MVESRIPLQLTEKPMKLLAVIPARGNSTRVPGKNKMKFGGVPCVVRTIEAVRECTYSPTIAVVSNDPEIRMLAATHGALALQEPPAVAKGDLYDVLYFALSKLEGPWEAVILAYANVPIRPPGLLDQMIDLWKETRPIALNARCLVRPGNAASMFLPKYLDTVFANRENVDVLGSVLLDFEQDQLVEIDTPEDVHWAEVLLQSGICQ